MVSLTTPNGQVVEGPSMAELALALDTLLDGEDRAADLWLEHDSGWTLSVVTTGDLFLENNDEEGDRYWTLGPLSREGILSVLQLLAAGNIEALRAQAWEEEE